MTDPQDPNFGGQPWSSPPPPAAPPSTWAAPNYGAPPPPPMPPGPGGYSPYPQMMPTNPFDSRATPVLIFGILGLVVCQLFGPVAWIMGNGVKRDAEAAGFPEPGLSKAGRICGIVSCVLLLVVIGGLILAFALGSTTTTTR